MKITLIKLRGGASEITKTILAVSVMVILVTGVIVPALQDAYAYPQKAQLSAEKLKAKSFGSKTINKIPLDEHNAKHSFGVLKNEQIKTYKKIVAEYNAKQILKNTYNLG